MWIVLVPFSPEDKQKAFDNIIAEIVNGRSIKNAVKFLKENNQITCSHESFQTWIAQDERLLAQYMRARENRADSRFESLDEIAEKLERGDITSDVARVLIDKIKWQCGKEKSKVYGDSSTTKLADADGNKLCLGDVIASIANKTTGLPDDKI